MIELTKSEDRPATEWEDDISHMAPGDAGVRFTDLADRLSWAVSSRSLPWEGEDDPASPHGEHLFDQWCAICKTPHAPWALRVVIDAVLDALIDDREFRALVVDPEEVQRG